EFTQGFTGLEIIELFMVGQGSLMKLGSLSMCDGVALHEVDRQAASYFLRNPFSAVFGADVYQSEMEPLSIAASLLAVLEATAVVSKATLELYRNVRDAPKELADLLNRISRTRVRLDVQVQLCQSLTSGNLARWIPDEALEAFQADLENAEACLESVRDIIPATSKDSNSRHRFNWVVREKRKVNKLLDNLRNIDSNLSAMLDTMSL
ncbi:MAG: hypothetical protein LQ349_008843, partial [Xanthoria aureola]